MKYLFSLVLLFLVHTSYAQDAAGAQSKKHRIIFQLTTDDTLAHKALMKQLQNIRSVAPETDIEVVCHGPGLSMLQKDKSVQPDKIQAFAKQNIRFYACLFSMKERKVNKESILPDAGFVEAGILYIIGRQEEGWSYIKSGF